MSSVIGAKYVNLYSIFSCQFFLMDFSLMDHFLRSQLTCCVPCFIISTRFPFGKVRCQSTRATEEKVQFDPTTSLPFRTFENRMQLPFTFSCRYSFCTIELTHLTFGKYADKKVFLHCFTEAPNLAKISSKIPEASNKQLF